MLGKTQKDSLSLVNEFNIKLVDLDESNSQWFKKYFEES